MIQPLYKRIVNSQGWTATSAGIRPKWDQILSIMFYVTLMSLGVIWVVLGDVWYAHILPFYDSLAYQTKVESILWAL